ncbi:GerAB/ArcD/ProY family transporter [Paenibacillus koleovorans]|uniref:GerAB/ArcD/ProY family transporter n=1 Tax=Paenibacillus koleovorans TaxID=121608 RepID=UPI0013E370AF|nr:endospore germination permease [Paenibacillus koleovorans]
MTTQVLTNTPIHFIHVIFLLVVIMGVRSGLETFTRTAEIFFPWAMMFFLIMVVLLPPEFHFNFLRPVFSQGVAPIVEAAIPLWSTPYMELIVMLMFLPFVSSVAKARKAFWIGTCIGGVLIAIISVLSILVLGVDLTATQMYPSYSLAKKISIGNFLERVEVVMAGIWFITIYFKLTISYYAGVMSFAEVFGLKDTRSLNLPFGILLIVLSIVVYPDVAYFMKFASKIDFAYSIPYALGFPLLIWLVAAIRKLKDKER